jgi:hypothetical protein
LGFKTAKKFGEAIDEGYGTKPLAVVDGWVAADNFASIDIAGNSALGSGYGPVAYGAVTGDADLTGKDDGFADGSGSSQANLSAEESILTDRRAVPHLNEIIDLGSSMNAGFADRGSIDAGVGLNLDGIFEDCGAGLKDLVPGPVGLAGEAKTVCADNGSVLKNDIVA